jgi:hypothetical protein
VIAADYTDPCECDCGRPKFGGAESCSHCADLDGKTLAEACVVAAMRSVGGWLTANELGGILKRNPGTVWRTIDDLNRRGRVARQWREIEGKLATQRCRYGTGTRAQVSGGGGCWEYSLAQKGRS